MSVKIKTTSAAKQECVEPTYSSWDGQFYPCGKTAKHEEGGKHYCGWHAPSRVAERGSKWDARNAERDRRSDRQARLKAAQAAIVGTATAWCMNQGTEYGLSLLDMLAQRVMELLDIQAETD